MLRRKVQGASNKVQGTRNKEGMSCPELSGQILNLKSDTNYGKTTEGNIPVQH